MDEADIEKMVGNIELTVALLDEMADFAKVMDRWDVKDPAKLRRYLELHKEFREKVEEELCSTADRS